MAAVRPWVTPDEVKNYTDHAEVAKRDEAKLQMDIFRAEQKVISITHNRFDGEELLELPEPVRIAVIILAETFAKNSMEMAKKQIRSETFDDYSYSVGSGIIDLEGLDLDYLLKDYMLDGNSGNVKLRMSVV